MACGRGAAEALHLGARTVARQLQLRSGVAMQVQPEVTRFCVDTRFILCLGESEEALHFVEFSLAARHLGRVEGAQIAQDDVDRPAVADDVMGGKYERPLLGFHTDQRVAYQRSTRQIE